MNQKLEDEKYIRQCIKLAAQGSSSSDFPFGSLLVHNNLVISEHYNETKDKREIYRHAEMLVLASAQKKLTFKELKESILYSTVEPCAMCSFAIQELGIARVVFGLRSPVMGGYTRWQILQDEKLGEVFPNTFGHQPVITPDVLSDEVINGWKAWDLLKWKRLINKGVFFES